MTLHPLAGRRGIPLLLLLLGGCTGHSVPTQPPPGVAVFPPQATLAAGETQRFTASVKDDAGGTVIWSVLEGDAGGAITADGLYTAPDAEGSYHLVATLAQTGASAVAQIAVEPFFPSRISVSVSPTSTSLGGCQSATFTASVSGTTRRAVVWSVQEGSAGGAVTSAGVYTAPATPGIYHVVATSVADPRRSATATIAVSTKVLSVTVSPSTVAVPTGGSAQFTATVTTTCGQTTSSAALTANPAPALN